MNIKNHIDNGGEVMSRNPDIEVEVLKTDMGGSTPILIRYRAKTEFRFWQLRSYHANGVFSTACELQASPNALDLIPK